MSNWTLDLTHSSASFSVRHLMVSTVRGTLAVSGGSIQYDPSNVAAASVEATLDANSINTQAADRDNHLRSADFFDVEKFPTITFKSTRVVPEGEGEAKIYGDLTLHGVTKEIVIDAEFLGTNKGMDGSERAGFTGTAKINREDWGLTWNVGLEAGGVLVGKDLKIELDIQAVKAS